MKFANIGSGEIAIYDDDTNLSWELSSQGREVAYRGQQMSVERPSIVRHMIFMSDVATRPEELVDYPIVVRERAIGALADGASTRYFAPDADQVDQFAKTALEAFPDEPIAQQLADLAA